MRVESKHYIMEWDGQKNRAYVRIFGFWEKPEDDPSFLADWRAVLTVARRGFTLLIDSSDFLTPPRDVLALISEAQKMSMEIGISRRAVIDPSSFIGILATDAAAQDSGILAITRKFKTRQDAERWLDAGEP